MGASKLKSLRATGPRKYEVFIREYLLDQNATRAAKAAGYSAKTAYSAGSRLLRNVEVGAAIEKGLQTQARDLERKACENGVTKERWLKEVALIAFSDFDEVAAIDDGNLKLLTPSERDASTGRVIKKVSKSKTGISIELHSKLVALELLGKAYGWLKERVVLGEGGREAVVIVAMPDNGRNPQLANK